jgi:hypothetical protein
VPHEHRCPQRGADRAALSIADQVAIVDQVMAFDAFTPDNDPYGEHDFGNFEHAGHRIFWKIDTYADDSLTYGAEDAADPAAVRVLTEVAATPK